MANPNFERLNARIRAAGADWIAGETPYSKYHGTKRGNILLGLALTPEAAFESLSDTRSNDIQMMAAAPPILPTNIDWRSHNSGNWVTSVKDQGDCGSCVAFATVATMESRALIRENKPGANYDLSEAHLFYCGTPNSCARGWQPKLALRFAEQNGIGDEQAFPYRPGNQPCQMIPAIIRVDTPMTAATSLARKSALQGGPVIAAFAVYDDFYSYRSGVYRHVAGNLLGYHAVCVIGYDDIRGCWIAKNSWTDRWGEQGFFNIRYGECGIDTQFPFDYPRDVDLLGNTIP